MRYGRRSHATPFLLFCVLVAFCGGVLYAADDSTVQFNRDIRQILADNCYACHGPDKNKREADLRLDDPEDALAEHDGKKIIALGMPDQSELFRRLTTEDVDQRMPPVESGKTLSAQQIELVRKWIQQGAKFEEHWSLIPPQRVQPPTVKNGDWPRNDIDRYLLARLEQIGVNPSADADRRTLIRRLSFDLTGLPPTPQEVDSFVNDSSAKAYEQLVDRLLSSEHFGERMAMYWLDIVRYADSAGYHSDNDRTVWPYRDYVIQSFNNNKPFDQFTMEQLAGDLLPNASNEQKIASGYNRLLQTTEEGGAQPKEYSAKYQADRVRNTSVIWMAATMGCCECHDHKYDPFATREFYQFAAFFADVQEKPVGRQDQTALPTPAQEAEMKKLDQKRQELVSQLDQSTPEITAAQDAWEKSSIAKIAAAASWSVVRPDKSESAGGANLTIQEDGSLLATGNNPDKDTYTLSGKTAGDRVTAVRVEAITHPSHANKSLSRANGNFVLTEFELDIQQPGQPPQRSKFKQAVSDFDQPGHPIAQAIDGNLETGWAVNGHVTAADHRAMLVLESPVSVSPGTLFVFRLRHESPYAKHNIGRFRISTTGVDNPSLDNAAGIPAEVAAVLPVAGDQRSDTQRQAVTKYFRSIAKELAPIRDQIAQADRQKDELSKQFLQSLVTVSVTPRTVRILPRGNWLDESGEVVTPGVPKSLGTLALPDGKATRLDLARWMASPENPLVARVFVNRLWKICFGQGIVKTLDDFGVQGEWPSHPELLDWLALEFRGSGWDVKHVLKLMVTSRAYLQSSQSSKDLRERDPANRWLARQASFRFDAEVVRDNALGVSGLLIRKIGGPSVKPYQPAGYWQYLNFPKREWQNDSGEDLYRRGLYTHWQRTFLHPSLAAFDAPSREESCCDRSRSNTPLQALALLNDPTYVEAARVLASRVIADGGTTDDQRLTFMFRQAIQRAPADTEAKMLRELVSKHREQYVASPAAADELLKVGAAPTPSGMNSAELAAWTSIARVILNLHETITRN